MLKILTVFGTRPEAIKMAPLVQTLAARPDIIKAQVAVTAQHREMLDQVLHLFQIKPDYDLNIMRPGQTLYDITGRTLAGLEKVLAAAAPDLVLVHGDTSTTFVAALAAFYKQIAVGHVEAGLRTGNIYSPFPEEMNRHLTGVLAQMHFAPTETAKANLLREGVNPDHIFVTGNTVIDALMATVDPAYRFADPVLQEIDFDHSRVLLMTTHRRENLGEPMRHIYQALGEVVTTHPDVQVVFPVHKNPAVRQVVEEVLGGLPRVHLIEPLDYQPFINLMQRCYLVLTDSGGLQEEAPALGKPVLVLRDTTERPEAVAAGTVKLVGTDRAAVLHSTNELLDSPAAYQAMAAAVNPYGDGQAARRIVDWICYKKNLPGQMPEPYAVNKKGNT